MTTYEANVFTTHTHWINGAYRTVEQGEYIIAHAREDGSWDMLDTINAGSADEVCAAVEAARPGDGEWYILDWTGKAAF